VGNELWSPRAPHLRVHGRAFAKRSSSLEVVEETFGLRCRVIDAPETGTPLVIPAARL
jgi:hypothetical protein